MNKETIELVLADSCAGPDGKGMRCNTDAVFFRRSGNYWIKTEYRSLIKAVSDVLEVIEISQADKQGD